MSIILQKQKAVTREGEVRFHQDLTKTKGSKNKTKFNQRKIDYSDLENNTAYLI